MSGMVGHACNARAREMEAEGPEFQGHLQVHRKFEDSWALAKHYNKLTKPKVNMCGTQNKLKI